MRLISLQSGSHGNAIYVEAGGVRLLIDAGISGRRAEERLARAGGDIRTVDAMLISHDHSDHIRSAGIFQRKFGLPMFVTTATLGARDDLGALGIVEYFRAGQTLRFNGVSVETIPTPHDGVDGCGFVIAAEGKRLGVLTDLGHVFHELPDVIASLDAVLLESNYDPELLRRSSYPPSVQNRIRGQGGHLSNGEAAALLARHGRRLRWAAVGHLSEKNNRPSLAVESARSAVRGRFPIHLAGRDDWTGPFEL